MKTANVVVYAKTRVVRKTIGAFYRVNSNFDYNKVVRISDDILNIYCIIKLNQVTPFISRTYLAFPCIT